MLKADNKHIAAKMDLKKESFFRFMCVCEPNGPCRVQSTQKVLSDVSLFFLLRADIKMCMMIHKNCLLYFLSQGLYANHHHYNNDSKNGPKQRSVAYVVRATHFINLSTFLSEWFQAK